MTKDELNKKILSKFKTGTAFFRYLNYKAPEKSWWAFKQTPAVNLAMVKVLELLDGGKK